MASTWTSLHKHRKKWRHGRASVNKAHHDDKTTLSMWRAIPTAIPLSNGFLTDGRELTAPTRDSVQGVAQTYMCTYLQHWLKCSGPALVTSKKRLSDRLCALGPRTCIDIIEIGHVDQCPSLQSRAKGGAKHFLMAGKRCGRWEPHTRQGQCLNQTWQLATAYAAEWPANLSPSSL